MKPLMAVLICIAATAIILGSDCSKKPESSSVAAVSIDPVKLQMFQPLPEIMPSSTNPITDE